jgi:peptidyl-prolyl cis-trans isomerase SurA
MMPMQFYLSLQRPAKGLKSMPQISASRRSRTRHVAWAFLLALALSFAAVAKPTIAQEDEQRIVVLVNDTPISAFDISQRTRLLSVTTRQKPSDALRKKATDELISEAIQLQEAKKYGIVVPKEKIDSALNKIAKRNNMTGDKLIAALGQLGIHKRTFRRKFEAQIAWGQVVRGKFRNQVAVGGAQIDRALSDRKPEDGDGKETTVYRLQRVRLKLPENPSQKSIAERLVEAERLRQRIKGCDGIEDAVRSISGSSVKTIGRKTAEQIVQPSRALLAVAKPGQLTPAYITATGVELYAVCSRRSVQADDEQREKVQRELMGQEFQILALRHLRDLRQEAFVEYR